MRSAFSLVELSIVLVILGLLTGGILAGQSLIRASEMRSIVTDLQRYNAASMAFRDKYFAIPGDMTNATSFWGVAHATPATCKTTNSQALADPRATCNGNGDGQIDYWLVGSNELFRYWQHLANAGLIEGSYTGIAGLDDLRDAIVGVNVPAARVSRAGYSVEYHAAVDSSDIYYWAGNLGNMLAVGAENGIVNTEAPIFTPSDAWNFDTKIDDGRPGIGKLRSQKGYSSCHTTQVQDTSQYAVSTTTISCQILWYGFI